MIDFVLAIGIGDTLLKSRFLIESIQRHHPESEIYAFVANEELNQIPDYYIPFLRDNDVNVIYGNIPMKDYIFTVKHSAMIIAGKQSNADYLCCLDSDMLFLRRMEVDEKSNMYVVPVDVGNTSWGRESSLPLWKRLYKEVGETPPKERITPIADGYSMIPYYNGGFVIARKSFGKEWLSLTKKVFKKIESLDSYKKYRTQSKRRRLFTRIPYSHWTEQVTLTLLAKKYNATQLSYAYDYPLNIMRACPIDTRLVHYHDFRNLYKIYDRLPQSLQEYTQDNFNKITTYFKLNAYAMMRGMKIKVGKF